MKSNLITSTTRLRRLRIGSVKGKVAIIGAGCCKFGENFEQNYDDMVIDAAYEILEDAGL